MQKNHFLSLKKFKNTESAQLCVWPTLSRPLPVQLIQLDPPSAAKIDPKARSKGGMSDTMAGAQWLGPARANTQAQKPLSTGTDS